MSSDNTDNDVPVPGDAYAELAEYRARTGLDERAALSRAIHHANRAQAEATTVADRPFRAVLYLSSAAFWLVAALALVEDAAAAGWLPSPVSGLAPAPEAVLPPAIVVVGLAALVARLAERGLLPGT